MHATLQHEVERRIAVHAHAIVRIALADRGLERETQHGNAAHPALGDLPDTCRLSREWGRARR